MVSWRGHYQPDAKVWERCECGAQKRLGRLLPSVPGIYAHSPTHSPARRREDEWNIRSGFVNR